MTYFASSRQITDLIKSNIELEQKLKQFENVDFVIISNGNHNERSMGVIDPFFGCDTQYIKLLTKNIELKQKLNQLTNK